VPLTGLTHLPLYEVKADLFKGLAHPLRIRVLEILAEHPAEQVPVADLLQDTGLEASHLSQHLSVLRRNNLVLADRRGSQVFYRLAYPQVADLLSVARVLLAEILRTTHEQLEATATLPPLASAVTGSKR
jgi:ArsR family transcriptional regulator